MTAINVSSISSSLTGSTFDWQSFVDQMIQIDSAPITTLQAEQSTNSEKSSALETLKTDLTDLQTATKALNATTLFTGRKVASSSSTSSWNLTAAAGAKTGAYTFDVTQLATASTRTGANHISSPISTSNDVSGVTLATMPTATAITAGSFTINGAQVNVALTDSLQDVFDKISTATGGAVTASYDHNSDTMSLNSSSEIVLGGANDSSNFLTTTHLANNGTGLISSANPLGSTSLTAPLASARLSKAFSIDDGSGNGSFAVDSSGKGSFTINGVAINYNINTDSLSTIIGRINSSSTGVTASYDSSADRMVIVNNATGDTGFGLSETAGGFLDAVGLSTSSTGASTTRGKNALFSINGGSTLTSSSNSLTSAVTGITGLTVQATTKDSQTISISSDTASMKSVIQTFLDKYNAVQSYIDTETATSVSNGKVTTSTFSGDSTVEGWSSALRSKAFSAVSGLSGTVKRLSDLGIDFSSTSSQLSISDGAKLDTALANNPDDVAAFFNTASTGFAATMDSYLSKLTDSSSTTGITSMESKYTAKNTSIDAQIAQIQRQLDSERASMTTSFQAMQTAQTNSKSLIDLLKSSFSSSSSG
jgi:flagellar hook-associated protein 2